MLAFRVPSNVSTPGSFTRRTPQTLATALRPQLIGNTSRNTTKRMTRRTYESCTVTCQQRPTTATTKPTNTTVVTPSVPAEQT